MEREDGNEIDSPSRLEYNQPMAVNHKSVPCIAVLTFLLAFSLFAQEEGLQPVVFRFRGALHLLYVQKTSLGADVMLEKDGQCTTLSSDMDGENICPAAWEFGEDTVITWVNYRSGEAAIGWRSMQSGAGGLERPEKFKFISTPQVFFTDGFPRALVFLGNRSDNDDVFLLDLSHKTLLNISDTPYSEKRFSLSESGETLKIETESLDRVVVYSVSGETLRVSAVGRGRVPFREEALAPRSAVSCDATNTYLAFGDSITWGKMRMNNLSGEYHPELAYPALIQSLIKDSYGPSFPVNLGVPGETTTDGAMRITTDLAKNPAKYFLLMMGTNDCVSNQFSIDSSMENLKYIVDRALGLNLDVIISTIPPRKDSFNQFEYVRNNIQSLNAGIQNLVFQKFLVRQPILSIDTHQAFMAYNPPDGWKTLLEDIVGNHPSPTGQQVIAGLFSPMLLSFAPAVPSGIELVNASGNQKTFQWSGNCESDFGFYQIEFGFSPDRLNRSVTVAESRFTFSTFPFLPGIYFRVQAVDRFENRSDFTQVVSAGSEK